MNCSGRPERGAIRFRGKNIRALARLFVPGLGLHPSDSYGYPLRSSPAHRLAYPSPSSRVLGEISGLIVSGPGLPGPKKRQ